MVAKAEAKPALSGICGIKHNGVLIASRNFNEYLVIDS